MRKVLLLIGILLAVTIVSCNSDNDKPKDEAKFSAGFNGEFTNYGTSSGMMGYVTIDNNVATLDFLAGKLTGTASKNGDNYTLSITQTLGVFENILNITGEIDTFSNTLTVNGTNLDGSAAVISGNINVVTDGGFGSLTKSIVNFVHDEIGKTASVTINGVTHSGLTPARWGDEENMTNTCERLLTWSHMRSNHDIIQPTSNVSCHTFTLAGLAGGEPTVVTDCSIMYFVLDKNTQYSYTVTWSTGETYTKQLTSLDGGFILPVCLSADGNNGGALQPGTGKFKINGATYNTACLIESCANPNCTEAKCITMMTSDYSSRFFLYNIPESSGGTYQIHEISENQVGNSCTLYGNCFINYNEKHYLTKSGTLTKTGAKSFNFSCVVYNTDNPSETHTVTGSGSY